MPLHLTELMLPSLFCSHPFLLAGKSLVLSFRMLCLSLRTTCFFCPPLGLSSQFLGNGTSCRCTLCVQILCLFGALALLGRSTSTQWPLHRCLAEVLLLEPQTARLPS